MYLCHATFRERSVSADARQGGFTTVLALAAALLVWVGLPRAAFAVSHSCTVREVFVFPGRVHVLCNDSPPTHPQIRFFAVSTVDASFANRMLTLGTTAIVSGRRFIVEFSSGDTTGASFGCLVGDCRKAIGFGLE